MASLADEKGMNGAAAKPPIAAHPAFPFIVALWFAALLGLGSLVVPVPLVESFTVATGIAGIVPATAPPLGFTARALMALAFTAGGAIAGLVIARQVAKAHQVEPLRRTNPVAPAADRRPISAHDELGDEGLDGRSRLTQPRGRRALTAAEDHAAPDLPTLAPEPVAEPVLPTGFGRARALTPMGEDGDVDLADDPLELAVEAVDDALELAELAPLPAAVPSADATPGFTAFADPFVEESRTQTMDDRQFFPAPGNDHAPDERQEFHVPSTVAVAVAWNDEGAAEEAEANDEPEAEALDFSPSSSARQLFAPEDEYAGENGDEYDDTPDKVADAVADQDMPDPLGDDMPDDLGEDPGLVQLAQRLGASIEKRREFRAAKAALTASSAAQAFAPIAVPAAVPVEALAEDFGVAEPDEAAQAMAAWFSRPEQAPEQAPEPEQEPAAPAASRYPNADIGAQAPARQMFQPIAESEPEAPPAYLALAGFARIDIDDEEEEEGIADLATSLSLPLAGLAYPHLAQDEGTPDEDEPAEEDLGEEPDFGSLMASGNPFRQDQFDQQRQQFVRIEDEPEAGDWVVQPAVVFPAEAAPTLNAIPAAPQATPIETSEFQTPEFQTPEFQAQARINSEEHERALRDALLNLQRMSGTA